VHVVLDVEQRPPRRPAVRRAKDAAHVDVDIQRAVSAGADRADIGRRAPGRVPGVPALRLVEAGYRLELVVLETEEMRACRPDQ